MNTQTSTKANQYTTDPRQDAFLKAYYDPESQTYSNAYRSALAVGYSESTSKDILHNRPKWLSEKWGDSRHAEPEQLLEKLSEILEDGSVATRDRIKAIELMMKHYGMLKERLQVDARVLNIQSVLD